MKIIFHRALVEFRTRKAHRWVVREKDILRYLSAIFAVVIFYMTAWTVTDSIKIPHADHACPITWWHRVTEVGKPVVFIIRNAFQVTSVLTSYS